jgi:hypothetical protein
VVLTTQAKPRSGGDQHETIWWNRFAFKQ